MAHRNGELEISFEKRYPDSSVIEAGLPLALPQEESPPPITVLFGPSGAGKTTILRCLAGLERPDQGRIAYGEEIWFDSERGICLPPPRRRIGYLFQDYALFPHLTVEENILFGLAHSLRSARKPRVEAMISRFQLEGLEHRYPSQLSGGQAQRVALARVLAPEPRLLLLDEPLSALDGPSRETLRLVLREWLLQARVPTLLVTHDRIEALALGDVLAVLAGGKIRQVGAVEEVFSRPADLSVAQIVGVENIVPGRIIGVIPAEAGIQVEGAFAQAESSTGTPDRKSASVGLVRVQAGPLYLTALAEGRKQGHVFACIRAEEIILEKGTVGKVSARNQLKGRVVRIQDEGPLVRLTLDCGILLGALVTRQTQNDLDLDVGSEITALIKAPSIHLIPRGG